MTDGRELEAAGTWRSGLTGGAMRRGRQFDGIRVGHVLEDGAGGCGDDAGNVTPHTCQWKRASRNRRRVERSGLGRETLASAPSAARHTRNATMSQGPRVAPGPGLEQKKKRVLKTGFTCIRQACAAAILLLLDVPPYRLQRVPSSLAIAILLPGSPPLQSPCSDCQSINYSFPPPHSTLRATHLSTSALKRDREEFRAEKGDHGAPPYRSQCGDATSVPTGAHPTTSERPHRSDDMRKSR
nr:hypothetical protein CFP56_36390 [Quercus suber]